MIYKKYPFYIRSIVSIDANYGIGCNNELLWHNKEDMQHFRKTTQNSNIIMGRKTYESIGRLLPERNNIILSRRDIAGTNFKAVSSLEESLDACDPNKEVWIIGGGEIYKMFSPYIDIWCVTRINKYCQKAEVYLERFEHRYRMAQAKYNGEYTIELWLKPICLTDRVCLDMFKD